MSNVPDPDLTLILNQAAHGDRQAAEQVLPLVYEELRKLAAARVSKLPPGQTLQATALVHEAYLRICGREPEGWDGRRHFFFAASRAMRDLLVEDARRKGSLKRGGDRRRIDLPDFGMTVETPHEDLITLNDGLDELEKSDPESHEIVMLRYFTGLTAEETAEVIGTSLSTIKRKWRFARAWLYRTLEGDGDGSHE